jgi:hypothetical protein
VLVDGGGRFVGLHRVAPDIGAIEGYPHAPFHAADNDRLGIIGDRLPVVGAIRRRFRKRGAIETPWGEAVFVFKEEAV